MTTRRSLVEEEEEEDDSLWRQAGDFLTAMGRVAVYMTGFYLFFYAIQHHSVFFRVLGWQYQSDFIDYHRSWTEENAHTGEQLYALAREQPWNPIVVVPLAITATFRMFESLLHMFVLFILRVPTTPRTFGMILSETLIFVWRMIWRPYQYILNIFAAVLSYPLELMGGNPYVYMTQISALFGV